MKKLKRFGPALVLTFILGLTAFAGEIGTPCAPPQPGEVNTPCDPGQMMTPQASTTASPIGTPRTRVTESETSFTELAVRVLESLLPLF